MPTKIEWVKNDDGTNGETWNVTSGCDAVSAGCQNCWAKRMSKRLAGRFGYDKDEPFKVTWHEDKLFKPFRRGKPTTYFVCSMGDLFHKDVPDWWIDKVWAMMLICLHHEIPRRHKFMVLTKRPGRMRDYLLNEKRVAKIAHAAGNLMEQGDWWNDAMYRVDLCGDNVWLGVSCEDQETADERIHALLEIPTVKKFVSLEPLLGGISLDEYFYYGKGDLVDYPSKRTREWKQTLNLVIVGGESGPGARPMHPDWTRKVRDECEEAGVRFVFKQWGEFRPCELGCDCPNHQFEGGYTTYHWYPGGPVASRYENIKMIQLDEKTRALRIGKKAAGRELDGVVWG